MKSKTQTQPQTPKPFRHPTPAEVEQAERELMSEWAKKKPRIPCPPCCVDKTTN